VPDGFTPDLTSDVYLRDRVKGTTTRITAGPGGVPADWNSAQPTISGDGRWIAYSSGAHNLGDVDITPVASMDYPTGYSYEPTRIFGYDVYLYDRVTGTHHIVSRDTSGIQGLDVSMQPSLSRDGGVLTYTSRATNLVPDDTNGLWDVFVYQRNM
jgi:Tol biopolymer transport system component